MGHNCPPTDLQHNTLEPIISELTAHQPQRGDGPVGGLRCGVAQRAGAPQLRAAERPGPGRDGGLRGGQDDLPGHRRRCPPPPNPSCARLGTPGCSGVIVWIAQSVFCHFLSLETMLQWEFAHSRVLCGVDAQRGASLEVAGVTVFLFLQYPERST